MEKVSTLQEALDPVRFQAWLKTKNPHEEFVYIAGQVTERNPGCAITQYLNETIDLPVGCSAECDPETARICTRNTVYEIGRLPASMDLAVKGWRFPTFGKALSRLTKLIDTGLADFSRADESKVRKAMDLVDD